MDLGITQRTAMVAASTQGLGRGAAACLAREGCRVSLCGRTPETLEQARQELEALAPGRVLAVPCDVSQAEHLDRWFQATERDLGPVDILVTSTGGPPAATFMDLSEDQWHAGVESTLLNVVRLCRLVLPGMRERGWGRIVNLTSFVAKQPTPLLTISSTLRAGLSALTRTLATEVAAEGITVNAVLPGHYLTGRQQHLAEVRSRREGLPVEAVLARSRNAIPAQRFGDPSELGDLVAFLCSDRAAYITGASIVADGGLSTGTFG